MAETRTARLSLPSYSAGTDAFSRADWNETTANLDANAAMFVQGALAARPAAAKAGRFYHATDYDLTYYDDGGAWLPVGGGRVYSVERAAPTVVNDTVELGSITQTNGAIAALVTVTAEGGGTSLAKVYALTSSYGAGNYTATPISSTGSYNGQDLALEVLHGTTTTVLRVRKTAGTIAATIRATIELVGAVVNQTFAESSATLTNPAAVPLNNGALAGNALEGALLRAPAIGSGQSGPVLRALRASDGAVRFTLHNDGRATVGDGLTTDLGAALNVIAGQFGTRHGLIVRSNGSGRVAEFQTSNALVASMVDNNGELWLRSAVARLITSTDLATISGELGHYSGNVAGARYYGLINRAADYLGLYSDVGGITLGVAGGGAWQLTNTATSVNRRMVLSGGSGTAYNTGELELFRSGVAPTLGFHNAGVVAGTLTINAEGAITASAATNAGNGRLHADGFVSTAVGFLLRGNGAAAPADADSWMTATAAGKVPLVVRGWTGTGGTAPAFRVLQGLNGFTALEVGVDGVTTLGRGFIVNGNGTTSTINGTLDVRGAGPTMQLRAASSDHVYLELYARTAALSTRSGYLGYGSTGTTTLSLVNEAGPVLIDTTNTITLGGTATTAAGGFTSPLLRASVVGGGGVTRSEVRQDYALLHYFAAEAEPRLMLTRDTPPGTAHGVPAGAYGGLYLGNGGASVVDVALVRPTGATSQLEVYAGGARRLVLSASGFRTHIGLITEADVQVDSGTRRTIYPNGPAVTAAGGNVGFQVRSTGTGVLELNGDGGGDVVISRQGGGSTHARNSLIVSGGHGGVVTHRAGDTTSVRGYFVGGVDAGGNFAQSTIPGDTVIRPESAGARVVITRAGVDGNDVQLDGARGTVRVGVSAGGQGAPVTSDGIDLLLESLLA